MDANQAAPASTTSPGQKPRPKYQLKPWKIALFGFAGLLLVVGVVLTLSGHGSKGKSSSGGGSGGGNVFTTNFDGTTTSTGGGDATAGDGGIDWATALTKGGISFFAAFCLAYAFRSFLKLAIVFIGVLAAVMFLFSYFGWIEVHWDLIDSTFKSGAGKLGGQLSSVESFVTGSLPSAGLASAGLFTGFKKH
jgi:uncharacterized membrane protein (Fun14 family)